MRLTRREILLTPEKRRFRVTSPPVDRQAVGHLTPLIDAASPVA